MRIALFGGTGFVGKAVAAMLHDAASDFFEISRSASGRNSFHADITDYATLERISERADVAIICSSMLPKATYKPGDLSSFVSVNILGIKNILLWARERGIKRIIYCSSLSLVLHTQGDETELIDLSSHYQYKITKAAGEHLVMGFCRQHALNYVVLRIASVYGAGMKKDVIHTIIAKIENREKFSINNSNTTIDFINVRDVAKTIVECIGAGGQNTIINVASCQPVTLAELVKLIGRLRGIEKIEIGVRSDHPIPAKVYSNKKMIGLIGRVTPLEEGLREVVTPIGIVSTAANSKIKVLILGGTRFLGLELFRRFSSNANFEVHVASRRDPGNYPHYHPIDRKNPNDISKLIREQPFDIIVDFISYSMPDAQKLIDSIRSRRNYNPYIVSISTTYVYGDPKAITTDSVFTEESFSPRDFAASTRDRPEIDYFMGKRSMESHIANHYDNFVFVRLPVVLGENDYTGKTTYFVDLIRKKEKVSFDDEFGVSNFVFSEEASEALVQLIDSRITGPLNCCQNDQLDQLDILGMYCDFYKSSVKDVVEPGCYKVKSPFFYRKDFIIDNSKQRAIFDLKTSFETALRRELRKLSDKLR